MIVRDCPTCRHDVPGDCGHPDVVAMPSEQRVAWWKDNVDKASVGLDCDKWEEADGAA